MSENGVQGTLRAEDGRGVVRIEHRLMTDVEDAWSALTHPDRLERWVARVQGDLRLDALVHAEFTSGWSGSLRVDVCDAPRRLVVTSEPGTDDETVIEATLEPAGDAVHLVIEERGLPLKTLAQHGAGWQVHVEDLAAYLGGEAPSEWSERAAQLSEAWTSTAPSSSGRS